MATKQENTPLLSVCVITYNHEKFISQCMQGILEQITDFDFEVVVGEDCSTDNTRQILLDFQKKYPEKIRLLLPDKNLGGHKNFITTFEACTGKYIALLEGDDYWIDSSKLQKQVDLLESSPEVAICFHNCEEFYDDGSRPSWNYCPGGLPYILELEDLISRCNFIPTCSAVFRNNLFETFPAWYTTLNLGDWTLHLLNAQYGKIAYMNEVMSKHRHHGGGHWSFRSKISNIQDVIKAYQVINLHFDRKFDQVISQKVSDFYNDIAVEYSKVAPSEAFRYSWKSLTSSNKKLKSLQHLLYNAARIIRNLLGGGRYTSEN